MSVVVTTTPNSVINIMTAEAIRDAILSLPDGDRVLVISRPTSGQKGIVAIQKGANGKVEVECMSKAIL